MMQLQEWKNLLLSFDPQEVEYLVMRIKAKKDRKDAIYKVKEEIQLFVAKYSENEKYLNERFERHISRMIIEQVRLEYGLDLSKIRNEHRKNLSIFRRCWNIKVFLDHINPPLLDIDNIDSPRFIKKELNSLSEILDYEVSFSEIIDLHRKYDELSEFSRRAVNKADGLFLQLEDRIDKDVFKQINDHVCEVAEAIDIIDSNMEIHPEKIPQAPGRNRRVLYESLLAFLGPEKYKVFEEAAESYIGKFGKIDPRFCKRILEYYGGAKAQNIAQMHFVELVKKYQKGVCDFEPKSIFPKLSNDIKRDALLDKFYPLKGKTEDIH